MMAVALLLVALAFVVEAGPPATRETVLRWVDGYAQRYGANARELRAVCECESKCQPFALGEAGELGPFQWLQPLWAITPQAEAGYHRIDPEANVAAAAWVFGQQPELRSHWTCWRRLR